MLINGSIVLPKNTPCFHEKWAIKKQSSLKVTKIWKKLLSNRFYKKNYIQTYVIIAMLDSFRQFLIIIYIDIEEEINLITLHAVILVLVYDNNNDSA